MAAYVDLAYVKSVGSMPSADVDAVNDLFPGTFTTIAESVSRLFDGRLAKRYTTPVENPPEELKLHVAHVILWHFWNKRGRNASSEQDSLVIDGNKDAAMAWLEELADSENGKIELPRRVVGKPDADQITKGAPFVYSESSPNEWIDRQAEAVRGHR